MRNRPWLMVALSLGLSLGHDNVEAQPRADVNGLVHEMAAQVQTLGERIDAEMSRNADGRRLARDTRDVADALARFHDTIHRDPDPRRLERSFATVDESWHRLQGELARRQISPAVERAARRVDQTDAELHRAFGFDGRLVPRPTYRPGPAYPSPGPGGSHDHGHGRPPHATPPPPGVGSHDRFAMRPPYNPVAAILPMADQLVGQTDEFLQRFIPLADSVPERQGFIADTRSLRDDAARLSRAVRQGAPPNQIRNQVQDLDRIYRRLNKRLNRVAKGRPPGPNIVAILQFGETIQAITRQLEFGLPVDPLTPPFGEPYRSFP